MTESNIERKRGEKNRKTQTSTSKELTNKHYIHIYTSGIERAERGRRETETDDSETDNARDTDRDRTERGRKAGT